MVAEFFITLGSPAVSQNIQIIIALVALAAVAFTFVLVRKSGSTKSELDESARTPIANVDVESSSISQTDRKSEIAAHADQHSEVIEQPVGQAEINEQSQTLEQPSRSVENQPSLQSRLGRSRGSLTSAFRGLFSSTGVSDDAWENLEDTLIMADMGVQATSKVIEHLKAAVKKSNVADENGMLDLAKVELTKIVDAGLDRSLHLARHDEAPAVALTVGVNGTGKTTTTAKLAHLLASKDNDVLLGAADTFRAAAAEQLTTWGDRLGVPVVRGEEGSDPASVAFNAVTAGKVCGEVESTKSVSEIYSPLSGTIVTVNTSLDGAPELINSAPYGDGWIAEIEIVGGLPSEGLLTANEYATLTA